MDLLAAAGNARDKAFAGQRSNDRSRGALELGGRRVELSSIRVPVLVIVGQHDVIAPLGAGRRDGEPLTGAPWALFESAPGGHLGVLTRRRSRDTTWAHLDAFLDAQASKGHAPRQSRAPR